jgi:multidrug efflux pump subunit AcrB
MVALILTPALCATLLKPIPKAIMRKSAASSAGLTAVFDRSADGYASGVAAFLRHSGRALIFYAGIGVAVVVLFLRAPTGFLPDEDTGVLFAMAQLPPGSDPRAGGQGP